MKYFNSLLKNHSYFINKSYNKIIFCNLIIVYVKKVKKDYMFLIIKNIIQNISTHF